MIDPEKFLRKYEKTFGRHADYFKAATVIAAVSEENPSSVANGDSSSSEELVHRAETFERMAFKIKEERDALLFVLTHGYDYCDVCVHRKEAENCEMDCDVCGLCHCPCKNCWISGSADNFALDLEFVESKMRKERGK